MTEAKHTPGPWKASNQHGRIYLLDAIGEGGKRKNIGDVAVDNPADARLIAAAPELLAYAECEKARRISLLPSDKGGTGNGYSYLETFDRHGFQKLGREPVFEFLDRLRGAAIAKARGQA